MTRTRCLAASHRWPCDSARRRQRASAAPAAVRPGEVQPSTKRSLFPAELPRERLRLTSDHGEALE